MHATAIEFKGGGFTLSVLSLCGADLPSLQQQLTDHIQRAPKLFAQMPVVLELNRLCASIPVESVISLVRQVGLAPMALQAQQQCHQQQAAELGLPLFKHGRSQANKLAAAMVVERPVRSGQQLYAEGSDLIVLAPVSAGAELVADGNIHVYGAMRGRAFAGASGMAEARIFCHNQQAELLSIAGHYQLTDHIDAAHWGKAIMVTLQQQQLIHQPLTLNQY
ncbi:septum site-determining protein MinC [uncultured Ferrimonas sp.]|uniref:septum site-determining protein MinC n=1 Tax=uncultured Ferrimonas sp. TaxID=432640 RepID=UPI002614DAA9|nr:septum site-determining protein MinC [uncultured Ferrimonas sp.]